MRPRSPFVVKGNAALSVGSNRRAVPKCNEDGKSWGRVVVNDYR